MEPAQLASERKRLRELSRYYCVTDFPVDQPLDVIVDSSEVGDSDDDDTRATAGVNSPARVSTDPTLTALAQLGVHRLECDRSFISLIDQNTQYIIAEATKSVSLLTENQHDDGDSLYLGLRSLPVGWGVCPNTIKCFTDPSFRPLSVTSNVLSDSSRYIVYDFLKEPTFQGRPYITGWPYMRFYAEVPLKSPRGYVIGSYCVVDNKPREDFSDSSVAVLREIASVIANHLELSRMKQDHQRAERLMEGLGAFVNDDSKAGPSRTPLARSVSRPNFALPSGTRLDNESKADEAAVEYRMQPNLSSSSGRLSSSAGSARASSYTTTPTPSTSIIIRTSDHYDNKRPTPDPQPPSQGQEQKRPGLAVVSGRAVSQTSFQASLVSPSIQDTFSRASHIIRESMDLDGLVFFDACLSGFGTSTKKATVPLERRNSVNIQGVSESQSSGLSSSGVPSETESLKGESKPEFALNIRDENSNPFDGARQDREPLSKSKQKMCERLGESAKSSASLKDSSLSSRHNSLPEHSLQKLLKRYPYGHIFHFDEAGLITSTDEDGPRSRQLNEVASKADNSRRSRRGKWAEGALLARLFPGTRSLILLPLWDSHKGRWYSAAFGWTTNPKRALQPEELTYVAAFSNSIMADVARLEAVATANAKSDFISSISHELRSPLHGILASAELLQDLSTGSDQDELIKMVENCGNTLLDTMNHLLDHAKINQFAQSDRVGESEVSDTISTISQNRLTSSLELSRLVEEVVEGVYTGYHFSTRPSENSTFQIDRTPTMINKFGAQGGKDQTLSIIFDMDQRRSWIFNTQAGAWKRIVMNLIGNSLKYTEAGFIRVALRAVDLPLTATSTNRTMIELTVSDTGRGMSEEYMKSRLYTAFAQEDNLSAGTGLGLSIVHEIIKTMRGTVNIRSEPGTGTEVKVVMPLEQCLEIEPSKERQASHDSISKVRRNSKGLTLCLVAFDAYPDIDEAPTGVLSVSGKRLLALKSALEHWATSWFDMKVVCSNSIGTVPADVFVVEQHYVESLRKEGREYEGILTSLGDAPMIVLNSDQHTGSQAMPSSEGKVIHYNQPFGPLKTANALSKFLDYRSGKRAYSDSLPSPTNINTRGGTKNAIWPEDIAQKSASKSTRSTATTALPSRSLDSQENRLALDRNKSRKGLDSRDTPKVLVVDDNDINQRILANFMRKLGCAHDTASDGLEAFEKYKAAVTTEPFDFILMDINMPIMDGISATQEIRAYEKRTRRERTINIIALSGLANATTQQEAFASGINVFLTKPVTLKTLKSFLGLDEDEPKKEV